mmetsp:Transcript_27799/g.24598  ORF Transcript_27799/g.24598 Transcript_27799/m.24598 type:complete len:255 (+) Transcript_27799:90-854(+)
MGFKNTLTITHATDGYSFTVDVDNDADALGIKVLIWEQQKVPIESQRLVFNGQEITDSVKIEQFGIKDGDKIFLIEVKKQEIECTSAVETIDITTVEPVMIEAPVQFIPNDYLYLDGQSEERNEWKIHSVVKLSCWIRAYLWLGFILTLFATLFCCLWSAVPMLFYMIGLIGARKLCKCALAFPIILTAIIGFGGLTLNLIWFYSIKQLIPIIISILHIAIFACICKLVIKIAQLNKTEFKQARTRIVSRSCCC